MGFAFGSRMDSRFSLWLIDMLEWSGFWDLFIVLMLGMIDKLVGGVETTPSHIIKGYG
jgi:hypothetical protein